MLQLLCEFGADTEDVNRLLSGMPGLPLAIAAAYHHLGCFALLLLHGAAPGLGGMDMAGVPEYVNSQCSVPHAIIKYRFEEGNKLVAQFFCQYVVLGPGARQSF